MLAFAPVHEAPAAFSGGVAPTRSPAIHWLRGITLAGLAADVLFRSVWIDPLAALAAAPILIEEGRSA
ncbi:MAG: hypothetical protein ACP5FH_12230 [Terracidiphilus sp.]